MTIYEWRTNTNTDTNIPSTMHLDKKQENKSVMQTINVGQTERNISLSGGFALILAGLKRRDFLGLLMALAGAELLFRGVTGHCPIYKALGINTAVSAQTAGVSVPHEQGIRVEESITIYRAPEVLYRYWRNFENLPRFMDMLESVDVLDERRSRWTVKAPAGLKISWDAEIVTEKQDELISWRSLEGSQVANAGTVRFVPDASGQGTEVQVKMEYVPPAGEVGAFIAKLFDKDPRRRTREELRRFKMIMETGEIATIEGQPSGRSKGEAI